VNRRVLPLALRLTVSLGLLALLTFSIGDPREIVARAASMRAVPLALAFALTILDRVLMAVKWRVLLTARGVRMPLSTAVRAYFASSFAGLFLPVTVGADAVRIFASRQYGAAEVTASIVVERVLGAASVVAVALAGCALIAGALTDLALRPIVIAMVAIGVAVTMAFPASLWLATRWSAAGGPDGSGSLVRRVATAYSAYSGHPVALSMFFLLSVLESLIPALIAFVVARGLQVEAPFWIFMAAMPIALMVARLPISLGGFGVQEISFVYLAGLVGLRASDAAATMLVMDAVLILTLLPAAFDVSILKQPRRTS
jgi:uncharacterized membrane protein YbhN (UPF0104 family)